jgi:hypothetical protein
VLDGSHLFSQKGLHLHCCVLLRGATIQTK